MTREDYIVFILSAGAKQGIGEKGEVVWTFDEAALIRIAELAPTAEASGSMTRIKTAKAVIDELQSDQALDETKRAAYLQRVVGVLTSADGKDAERLR